MHFNVKQLLTAQGADSIAMLTGTNYRIFFIQAR